LRRAQRRHAQKLPRQLRGSSIRVHGDTAHRDNGSSSGDGVRLEFGYMNQYTFRHNGPDKNDHILAANAFVNF
jgi:hypothetical protein